MTICIDMITARKMNGFSFNHCVYAYLSLYQPVQNHAKGVHVSFIVIPFTQVDLWSHESEGSGISAHFRWMLILHERRKSKVTNLEVAEVSHNIIKCLVSDCN